MREFSARPENEKILVEEMVRKADEVLIFQAGEHLKKHFAVSKFL